MAHTPVTWRLLYNGIYPGGPSLKVVRAEKHLAELESTLRLFLDGRPYVAMPQSHREKSLHVLRYEARVRREPPALMGPIIGDVLHNLRSALDGLIYLISAVHGAPEGFLNRCEFPISGNQCDYRCGTGRRTPKRDLVRFLPGAAQAIVRRCQPYRARQAYTEHPLWVLSGLVQRDKHRHIHVGGAYIRDIVAEITQTKNAQLVSESRHDRGPFVPGAVLAEFHLRITGADAELNVNEQFPFDIAFEKAGAATGLLVVPTLRRLVEYVSLVVEVLQPFAEERVIGVTERPSG